MGRGRRQGEIPRERIAELHAADCLQARVERRTMWNAQPSAVQSQAGPDNEQRGLNMFLIWVKLTDPPPADPAHPEAGPLAGAAQCRLTQEGNYFLRSREQVFRFHRERLDVENIYEAVNRPLSLEAAKSWHRDFFDALAVPHPRTAERGDPVPETEPLGRVFHTKMLHGMNREIGDGTSDSSLTKQYAPGARPRWIIHELRTHPGLEPFEGVAPRVEPLGGARGRIRFIMLEPKSGRRIYCNADLAHIEGAWRCVQFFYNPDSQL